ncbi:MAG: esterase [Gammaproteobacteria bacterium]|jgi:hypothetical protein
MRATRLPGIVSAYMIVMIAALTTACAPHKLYRENTTLCPSPQPDIECPTHALQEVADPDDPANRFLLGFIEFDDQGQLWNRDQMNAVVTKINEQAADSDVLMVVFVHGWKHSAGAGDSNISTFRGALQRVVRLENRISKTIDQPPRKVIGVYLGWRGGSITMPVLKELSFWDRKNTAGIVGHGGVTEVLARLELVKNTRDAIVAQETPINNKEPVVGQSRSRLVVIGHSFGGAIVFSAVSQILESRFVDTQGPFGQITNPRGFGNLVVLINPAFEAARFATLSDMSTERGTYFADQLPVMAILTSEGDKATRYAFPVGRWFSTLLEKDHEIKRKNGVTRKTETIDQGKANMIAVGHFKPYMTHKLTATDTRDRNTIAPPTIEEDINMLFSTLNGWENDAPGNVIQFNGSTLERNNRSAGRNPYLVIKVDKHLIRDHNDIDDPRIISFIRQLILLASQSAEIRDNNITREQLLESK